MLAFKRLPTSGYWVAHLVKALFLVHGWTLLPATLQDDA
uniref:Uncharacterized protein n=1 Tax=Anguilla anguilla TaxID=7936 RepID=A0A0E9S0Y5_ANGAN